MICLSTMSSHNVEWMANNENERGKKCFSSFKDIKLLHIGQIRWSFTKRCLWDELIGRCLFQSGLMNGAITLQIDDLIRRIVIRPVDCSRLTVFDFN